MLLARKKKSTLNALKQQLNSAFSMKDLGEVEYILGMQKGIGSSILCIYPKKSSLKKCWIDFVVDVKPLGVPLQPHVRLSKDDCPKDDDASNYMKNVPDASACGSTRPDISHAVGFVSRFMANPCRAHWEAIKSILGYFKGTKGKCLCYRKGPLELKGFCDSDTWSTSLCLCNPWSPRKRMCTFVVPRASNYFVAI